MPIAITLSSTSFANGALIPPEFKNNSLCGELNRSPQFSWAYTGFIMAYIDSFNLYVENINLTGSSPNGKFLHWGVNEIPSYQNAINENSAWPYPWTTALPSDYGAGDRNNGWNGPCYTGNSYNTYRAWIEVVFTEDACRYIWQNPETRPADCILRSNYYTFTDNITNVTLEPTSANCGTMTCPPGYTLINGICQETIVTGVVSSNITYTVTDALNSALFCAEGTRFYENADQYLLPLRGTLGHTPLQPTDAILQDNDGTGVILPFTLDNTHPLWKSSDVNTGRLNILGVWTGSSLPSQEWIGVSYCIAELPAAIKCCIGIGARTRIRVKLDGNIIIRLDRDDYFAHAGYWHVIEFTLSPGTHIIEVEGYAYAPVGPSMGFELYQASAQELMALSTVADLAGSGYVVHTSADEIGLPFDIGEGSGYHCPTGYAFNSCGDPGCVDINFVEPLIINCCWRIGNCHSQEFEVYTIQFDPNELTPLYGGNVYSLAGPSIFEGKCFQLIEQVVCDAPQYMNVTVIEDHGQNCNACSPALIFKACEDDSLYYVKLTAPVPPLTLGNVYGLSIMPKCFTYMGITEEHAPDYEDVEVVIDYHTSECSVCGGALKFRSCTNAEEVILKLAAGQDNPDLADVNTIYHLSGDPSLLDICWQFIEYVDDIVPSIYNVIIDSHTECTYCVNCVAYYKLTDCTNSENISYIYWEGSTPLSADSVYLFDFAPDTCYIPEFQFSPCEDVEPTPIYDTENIISEYPNGCAECNALCYKITDCGEETPVGASTEDLSMYIGKIIHWIDTEQVEHCSFVEPYTCRTEEYPIINITIDSCFNTCDECLPPVIVPEDFSITHRAVRPGYSVPGCNTTVPSTPCGCSPDVCIPPCSNCINT